MAKSHPGLPNFYVMITDANGEAVTILSFPTYSLALARFKTERDSRKGAARDAVHLGRLNHHDVSKVA